MPNDLSQWLSELGSSENLNELKGEEWVSTFEKLLENVKNTMVGDVVAIVSQNKIMPEFGVVVGKSDSLVTVAISENEVENEVFPLDYKVDGWEIGDKEPRVVQISGKDYDLANAFLRSTHVIEKYFGDTKKYGMSWYVLESMRKTVNRLRYDLGFGLMKSEGDDEEKLNEIAKTLPGRSDEMNEDRGYVGWGPYEDYGKTRQVENFDIFVEETEKNKMMVYDFYFSKTHDSEECPCCDGSGKNREYMELDKSFYEHGEGSRWRGWGSNLLQEEIDMLVKEGRLRVPEGEKATVENYKKYFATRLGHDAIDRWLLTEMRAKHMGISCEKCEECDGEGRVKLSGERLELNVWVGIPEKEVAVIYEVKKVGLNELEEIKSFMKSKYEELKQEMTSVENGKTQKICEQRQGREKNGFGWDSDCFLETFEEFEKWTVDDLNLPVGYTLIQEKMGKIEDGVDMLVYMIHPRKGAHRTLKVSGVREEHREKIVEIMKKGLEIHDKHFAWAESFGVQMKP